jgi:hypothetical protein
MLRREKVTMFLCFPDEYSGFAVKMSEEKWRQISDDPFPRSLDEMFDKIIFVPVKILVDESGKYPNLISVEVNRDQFLYASTDDIAAQYADGEDEIPF